MTARDAPPAASNPRGGRAHRRGWRIARWVLVIAFFAVVAALLVSQARSIDWSEVVGTVLDYPVTTLLEAAAVAATGYAVYCCFDLLGRAWTGHRLPVRSVVPVTFVSYAFNLNLGSLIGGFGFRYRLYSRLGLDSETITRVLGLSLVTNWLGYVALAGVVFASRVIAPPADWRIGATALQMLGLVMLALAAAYVLACGFSRRRSWTVHGHEITLPPLRLALWQLALSCANWMLIAGVPYLLLQRQIGYASVLGVLLIAAVVGAIMHIPAGLGVIEAVFIALLEGQQTRGELLAALLGYRALYYLAPLILAVGVYLMLEARAKKTAAAQAPTAVARCPSAGHPAAGADG